MVPKKRALQKMALAFFLVCLFLLSQSTLAGAGCGCDKPPPAPAAVRPNVAYTGMQVTLSDVSFQEGEIWNVSFQSSSGTATVTASVESRRDLADPTEMTYTPQLVVTVPSSMPIGPVQILAEYSAAENDPLPEPLVVEGSLLVIAKPLKISPLNTAEYKIKNYTTAVDSDNILYISIGGLDAVCQAMSFKAFMINYPLRFGVGDMLIFNAQGFLVEALDAASASHFSIQSHAGPNSNSLYYSRHSFEQYCADHQPGGSKEVDPEDLNWHLNDNTPHVDFSTLIFAIAGHFDDGTVPTPGTAIFDLNVVTNSDSRKEEKEEGIK